MLSDSGEIVPGDLNNPAVIQLLQHHLDEMALHSPPESIHALEPEGLKSPDVSFFCLWDNEVLKGCAALKQLDARRGEIKSMRTATAYLRQGVAARLLEHLTEIARRRQYQSLWLETGSMRAFAPARRLYSRYGFIECAPFAGYSSDPHSVFMTLDLTTS